MSNSLDLIQAHADLSLARQLAEEAGHYIASRWDSVLEIQHKGMIDLVSEVDLKAEQMIITGLQQARPQDLICAEESSADQDVLKKNDRVWYVDPLDGTTNFSHGFPHFCTSIALWENQQPQIAVIYQPLTQWTFYAIRTQGAWRNGQRIHVSKTEELTQALLATGFPYDRHHSTHDNINQTAKILKHCQGLRRAGAAALDLAYVSCGWLDGYWEYKLQPWDTAAGILLVQEAGGIIHDDQQNQDWFTRRSVVCAGSLSLYQSLQNMLCSLSS